MNSKWYSESCDQNREPILAILQKVLCNNNRLLEIGSGSGQHAVYFSKFLRHIHWQPSDRSENITSIEAWREEAELTNVNSAIVLDVDQKEWPELSIDAIFSANAVHIMSWPSVKNLMRGVGNLFDSNDSGECRLCLYGPFNYGGNYSSDSNARFDQWLKGRDSASGIRHFEDMCELASQNNMHLQDDFEMPANNRILVFRKEA